jgi:hypothetical protein
MMRIVTATILTAFAGILLLSEAQAQTARSGWHQVPTARLVTSETRIATEFTAQRRVRPPTRLRVYPRPSLEPDEVYPRYYPGRNAVRDCTAFYAPEYRPSGTVIVPHMSCYWRRG